MYGTPRNNLKGEVIKIGILERGDNWTNPMDWNKKYINTVTKVNTLNFIKFLKPLRS